MVNLRCLIVAYLIHCWGYLLEKGKNNWKKFKPLDLVKKQTENKRKSGFKATWCYFRSSLLCSKDHFRCILKGKKSEKKDTLYCFSPKYRFLKKYIRTIYRSWNYVKPIKKTPQLSKWVQHIDYKMSPQQFGAFPPFTSFMIYNHM